MAFGFQGKGQMLMTRDGICSTGILSETVSVKCLEQHKPSINSSIIILVLFNYYYRDLI